MIPWQKGTLWPTFVGMIRIGSTLLSEDLFDEHFACDLGACKGACCVQGDSGAPLTQRELGQLEQVWDEVQPYLPAKGVQAVKEQGLAIRDDDNDLVTPLVEGKECAFTVFDENGMASCGIERAYLDGKTEWRKPLSCHLYPIRVKELVDFTALNYHRWPICEAARLCGSKQSMTVLDFCKDALIRRFGEAWYEEAQTVQQAWKSSSDTSS